MNTLLRNFFVTWQASRITGVKESSLSVIVEHIMHKPVPTKEV